MKKSEIPARYRWRVKHRQVVMAYAQTHSLRATGRAMPRRSLRTASGPPPSCSTINLARRTGSCFHWRKRWAHYRVKTDNTSRAFQ